MDLWVKCNQLKLNNSYCQRIPKLPEFTYSPLIKRDSLLKKINQLRSLLNKNKFHFHISNFIFTTYYLLRLLICQQY